MKVNGFKVEGMAKGYTLISKIQYTTRGNGQKES